MKIFAYYTVPVLLGFLLMIMPLFYCVIKGSFWTGFRFTWWTWAITLFVFGLSIPWYCKIKEEITGVHFDAEGMVIGMGIILGWLPGLIFASLGVLFSQIFCRKPKDIIYSKKQVKG